MMTVLPPILRDFPEQFETERLIIRAPRPGDGAMVNAAVIETLDNLRPWMPWVHPIPSVEDTEIVMRKAAADYIRRKEIMWLLMHKADGIFVGASGLHHIDWTLPRFETGYWVRASLEGQGYITEAVNGITDFAIDVLGAVRMEITCDARNTRSAAVARRARYTLEATLRHERRDVYGELSDTLVFARIAPDAR